MQLLVDGNSYSNHPGELDITRVLSELAAGEYTTIALHNTAANMLTQVGRRKDGTFILEVENHQLNTSFQSSEHFLDSATVTDVFLSILEGNNRWETETNWVKVDKTQLRSGKKVANWVWMFLAVDFVITIIIVVVVVLTSM